MNELSDYLDEAVGVDLRKELEQHVSECPNCWVVVDTTKKTLKVYKGMEPQAVPEDIRARLLDALQRKMAAKGASGSH